MATIKAARSPLYYQTVKGGLPFISDASKFTGNIFYVDSNASGKSDTAGYGYSPDKPFATLSFAVSQCTASQGDVILLLPGHAETLAAVVTISTAGIKIIGLGYGDARPAFTVSGAIDGISVEADDVEIENVRFITPSAVATSQINIAAADCAVRRCGFAQGANSRDAITVTAAGEKPTIEECDVIVAANGPDSWIKFEGVIDRPVVRHNLVIGSDATNAYDDGVLNFAAVATTNPMVYQNYFDGADVATTVIANGGSVVGGSYGRNYYSGSATDGDNVPGLAANAITAAVIATGAIDADAIADNAIDAGAIAANAITAAKIADGAIDAATFAAGAIDAAAIAAGAIDAATFAAGAIDAAAIANSAIDAATFAAGAINAAAIADGAIDAATFAAGAINAAAIADGAIDAATFAAGAIDAAAIAAGAIDAATFAAGAIDAAAIANSAIDAATFAAGAIDAAAIANGAIDAATFAAGAIDAAAIANAAIDAATFAAGAIDAAAIATGAIDADAIADNAIDAGAIAADAITNAKIADNALASEQFALSAGEKTTDGVVVTKATAALPQSSSANIFTVTGLVLLKRIVGYVTTVIGAVANATKLKVDSTGAGATTDICGTLDLNAAAVDSRLEITGTFANALVKTVDVPLAKVQVTEVVIPPGSIMVDCAGSDGGTGRVRWSATYVPLESGAQIVAA